MKKKLFALLAAVMLLSLTACGGSAKGGSDMNSAAQTAPSAPEENFKFDAAVDTPAEDMGWDMPAPEPESPEGGYGGMESSFGGVPANAKIIYTADMDLETKEFDDAQKALEDVVRDLGGYFESRSVNQGGRYRSVNCTVRVPVKNFSAFLDQAGEVAHVTNRSEYLEDVSEAYYDQEARLETQRIKLERLQDLLGKAENMADIITIESAISDTELEIEYLTGSLRKYDSQINYSTVNLYLREVYRLSTDEAVPVTFGDRLAVQPPYLQTFEDKSSFELMKVIDANKDGLTWEWGEQSWINKQGVASCGDQYSDFAPSWDDWLLTPFINLEEGKTYELTFKVKGICWDPDYISVAFGTGDDVSKYKTAMPPTKIGVLNNFEEYKTVINSTSNQKVRIGFHRTSDYSDATMQIDDIRLSEGSSQSAPASVSDLIVTPDSKGALSADVSLTAPSVDKSGNPLQTITKIDLYVNQTLSHTFENPTPGSTLTHTVTVPDNATYSIKAEAFNDSGVSESVVASAFIGVDIPGNFKAWIEDHQDHITVRWEPCTTGQNGLYVNPDEMLYDIYAVEAELMTDILASDINGTSFDMNFDTDQGAIGGIQVALRAKNSAGESRGVATDILIVGDSYELPYEEHFDGNSGYIYDGSQDQNFGLLEAASSDGDDKCFGYVAMNGSAPYMELRTMKIALAGAKSPYLTFDYLITSDARIEAYVLTPDRKFETVAVADQKSENPHWLTAVADLSKYTDERYVRLFFRFYKGDGMMDIVPMDNLHILDAFGNDLAVSLTLPQEPTGFGEHADIAVKVLNSGVNACPAYKVNFFAGEELIESQEGSSLDFMKSADHHFSYEVLPGTMVPLRLSAQVQYEADENPDNNTAVAELSIRQAKVSAPENLSASQSQGIKLQWDAPSTFYSERITEDFESYYPWTITNFGKWTLIDADGANVVQLEEADFPNEGKPQAFTIFNPSSIGVPDANTEANPHSGNQYAACFAAKVRETEHNDDWLISPLLPGKAQKIGFYAKQMISSFGPEKLQLLYSVTGNQIEDFKLIEEFEINNPDDWKLFRADLPEGSKYFAFRVVTRDGHLLMLDDVIFTAGSCTEIISYNIYRSGQRIAQVGAPMTMYTDSDGKPNDRYNVTAVYATGEESDFSNTATITSSVDEIRAIGEAPFNVYSIDGKIILLDADNLDSLEPGLYIVNNKKMFIRKNK